MEGLPPELLKIIDSFKPDPNIVNRIHIPLMLSFDEAIQVFTLLKTLRADKKAE